MVMKIIVWITTVALVMLALFTAANWSLVTAPASLNFLAFSVQGPLGLILLGATLLLVALCAVYVLSLRTSTLVETRRHFKELDVQRQLADKAEASRFTALGTQISDELARTRTALDETRTQLLHRADMLEQSLLKSLNETANTLSAYVGEVDDKLDRLSSAAGSSLT
jgi:uncharacterized integral membrane protein